MKTKNSKGEYLKYLSFKGQGQQRYLRDRSLGEGYSKDEIMTRILEKDKGVYKISINEVLFKQKNENGHWEINKVDGKIRTRIPRNIKSTSGLLYWDIDENQCKKYEMLNQNKTLSIHFDDSMKINVYDAVGKLVTIMSAEELFSYYDDQSKSDLIQGQKLSEISTTSLSRAYPWGIRLQRIMQQEHSYNTKALVKAINTLSYEGVETRSDLRNKIADLQCQADEIPTKLEPIHTVTKDMQYILKNLRVYQENEKVYSGYLAKHKKEAFYDTFKNEIDSFLIAEKVLDERNIEPTSNVSEIEQRIEQAEQERIQIESELIELRDRLHALQYTNEVIEDVLESRETTYEIIQEKYQEK